MRHHSTANLKILVEILRKLENIHEHSVYVLLLIPLH